MEEGDKKVKLSDKLYLLVLKFIPHFLGINYIIYTVLQFVGIDLIEEGYLFHLALFPWIYMLVDSIKYRFCYVHRLPLYYILLNEIITITGFYLIPTSSVMNLCFAHAFVVLLLIFGYSKYYYDRINKVRIKKLSR